MTPRLSIHDPYEPSRPHTPPPSLPELPPKSEPEPAVPLVSATPTFTDLSPSRFLLPIPTPSGSRSRSSFLLSDVVDDANSFDLLSAEIASADISIAPDGSFVETSSGLAARELKRRYDQHFGVTISVRSPYAITAFVNQHGKQMFRVGNKDLSAPAASAAEVEQRVSQSKATSELSPPQTPRSKRRSRMSMHALLPPSMFKNPNTMTRPQTSNPGPRNKLRKTRSIPDMLLPSSSISIQSPHPPQGATATTGRAHSHSVTGADLNRVRSSIVDTAAHRSGDIFGDVMDWQPPLSDLCMSPSTQSLFLPRASSQVDSYEHAQFPAIIPHPFGPGVAFDSPSTRPATTEYLPPPHMLREMQSFESGLTARQNDPESPRSSRRGKAATFIAAIDPPDRPDSASSVRKVPDQHREAPFSPSPETSMHSRYSTDVFDVLQTYRGLPLLDKLSPGSGETTVIKMSLAADDTAAPRDDPRFVIWGEVQMDHGADNQSVLEGSLADRPMSVRSSSAPRKRSRKSGLPSVRISSGGATHKVVVAATIERWIAQLTSELNYDELLNFFLTYRTYISAVDLCHLFICRFHWALAQHTSTHDEMVRRIVRVRTFVAIRYWLLTFFSVDFLPNRELRLLVTNWLNTLIRDPILQKLKDGLSIARKLKKVVKDCKKAHMPSTKPTTISRSSMKPRPAASHVLGEKFAEALATRKTADAEDDSDVDLDFLPDEAASTPINPGFPSDPVNAHLNAVHVGAGLSPGRSTTAALSMLQQSNRTAIQDPAVPFVQTAATLPIHHNALSRVFVKTIGRLGRWKRVLNSRSTNRRPSGACADVSAFDLELTVSRDLLTVNGGVEQYLKMIEPQQSPITPTSPTLEIERTDNSSLSLSSTVFGDDLLPGSAEPDSASRIATIETAGVSLPLDSEADTLSSSDSIFSIEPSEKAKSIRSASTDSLGVPLSPGSRGFATSDQPFWQFDVVSIDELDLSDTSSDHAVEPSAPSGLRKAPRRLPLRRDFEFVRQSESVSSMGIHSRESVASTTSSILSSSEAGAEQGHGIWQMKQWQVNAIADSFSNDGETGDVEAALRRLEGEINPVLQQEKASKVDGWIRAMQERLTAETDHDDEYPQFSDEEEEEEGPREEAVDEEVTGSDSWSNLNEDVSVSALSLDVSLPLSGADSEANTPPATIHSGPTSPLRSSDARPALEDVVPLEILQSRVPSRPSTSSGSENPSMSLKLGTPERPRVHRSFILAYRAETLVEHFSMIDRELFMGVKFEELVQDDWMACEEVNVLDWGQFLKDRARWKAESRWPHKTSALAAVRARFNLIASFTLSEIVLTQPSERAVVMGKFIRIAWKAYCLSNFNTLVAIIAGLQSQWVTRAMSRFWSRVGMWETRVLRDLKAYCTNADDFRHIRQAVDLIADTKPADGQSHATSAISTSGTDGQSNKSKAGSEAKLPPCSACVPFIGVYLSQLYRHSKLPDLIDPTAPNEGVGVDPITANFDTPAHPEVFSALAPLLPSMQLEPLINVQKQRLIAGVIKGLVAGQHLASRVQFAVDRRMYQKCLKLRGLDEETLQRAIDMYPE